MDSDIIPILLPSGTKAVVDLPRPFTVADAIHLVAFLTQYIEDEAHGAAPVTVKMKVQNENKERKGNIPKGYEGHA